MSKILTLLVLGLGLAGLGRWLFDAFYLQIDFSPGKTMHITTAFGLIICSLCLGSLHLNHRRLALPGIILVLLTTFIALTELIWGLPTNIASYLLPAKSTLQLNSSSGLMLLLTTIIFFLLAAAMLLLTFKRFMLGQLLAAVLFITTYAALIDNLYSINGFPDKQNYIVISSQAALAVLLLSLALLLYCPTKGWMKLWASNYAGGMLARNTFTYFLLVSPVLIGFYLYSLSRWQFSPGLAILTLFLLTCLITLPITFFHLKRLNKLDAQLNRKQHQLETANSDLSGRNEELSDALADVKASNRELAVMAKEVLLSSRALETKNQELLRLNQGLDYIVHMASHDLKTPVFNLELLLQDLRPSLSPHLNPDDTQLLDMVENSVSSLKKTIDGLGQIIRSQQIIIGLQVCVSFAKLIQEIQTEMAREIETSQAQINLHLAVDSIVFSRLHLHSILYNLLSNALKYRAPNRPPIIRICARAVAGGIEIGCTDNGLGMTDYQVSKLFSLFSRFHAHTEGSGVGLYIVKLTVENNGGSIKAESTEGVGSRFTIFLPQKQV